MRRDTPPAPADDDPSSPAPGGPAHEVADQPRDGGHVWSSGWAGVLGRAAALAALVVVPTFGAALAGDKRWNIYRFGGDYLREPSGIVTRQLESIDFYLGLGNFRPLGRMFERLQDVTTFLIMDLLSISGHAAMRAFNAFSLALLACACLLFVERLARPGRLRDGGPHAISPIAGLWFAASLVAAGTLSSVVLFTDLYAQSFALVLLVATAATSTDALGRSTARLGEVAVAGLVGAAAAAFNEVAYLAAPVATLALFARGRLTLGLGIPPLLRSAAAKRVLAGWIGFLVVFVPVRVIIARRCAAGECYANSEFHLSADTVPLLAHRLASSLPPFGWRVAADRAEAGWTPPGGLASVLLALAIVAVAAAGLRHLLRAPAPAREGSMAVAVVGLLTAAGGAALAATTRGVHERWLDGLALGAGWRDSVIVAAGLAMLVAGLVGLLLDRAGPRARSAIAGAVVVTLVAACLVTVQANRAWLEGDLQDEESQLHRRIAAELHDLEDTDAHLARRCSLLEEYVQLRPGNTNHHSHLYNSLNSAAETMHGTTFCPRPDR